MNPRILCKAAHQYVVAQAVADSAHDHALVMRHIGVDGNDPGAAFLALGGVVDRFQHAIKAGISQFDKCSQIVGGFRGQDLKGKR